MFNYRPDTPWIYLNPEPVDDDPPGLRLGPDGSATDTQPRFSEFGSYPYSPSFYGASVGSTAYGLPHPLSQAPTDPAYNPFPFASAPRHPFQEAFDQLAGIYAGLDALKQQALGIGSVATDNDPRLQGSPVLLTQSSDPGVKFTSRVSDGRFTPFGDWSIQAPPSRFISEAGSPYLAGNSMAPRNTYLGGPHNRPSRAIPPVTAQGLNANEGEVLSDVASDDGLWDGQQYAQYHPPVAIGGVPSREWLELKLA